MRTTPIDLCEALTEATRAFTHHQDHKELSVEQLLVGFTQFIWCTLDVIKAEHGRPVADHVADGLFHAILDYRHDEVQDDHRTQERRA